MPEVRGTKTFPFVLLTHLFLPLESDATHQPGDREFPQPRRPDFRTTGSIGSLIPPLFEAEAGNIRSVSH